MIEEKVVLQSLPVRLSPGAETELTAKVACIALELGDLETFQKEEKARMRNDLKAVRKRLDDAMAALRCRSEERAVEVKVLMDVDKQTVTHVRLDTAEIIQERSMTAEEREIALRSKKKKAALADTSTLPPQQDVEPERLVEQLATSDPEGMWPGVVELRELSPESRGRIVSWLVRKDLGTDAPSEIRRWVEASGISTRLERRGLQGSREAILHWSDSQRASVVAWLNVSDTEGSELPFPPIVNTWAEEANT